MSHVFRISPARFFGLALCTVAFGAGVPPSTPAQAETSFLSESPAYVVAVDDIVAKLGTHAMMRVTLRPREGYRILKFYENRVARFSSADDGVAFDAKMIRGEVEGDSLVFEIGVTPTKPGKHPINGVFRVGYIHGSNDLSMVSLPLIANVTGTE
jgi:hypothetical protein